jgi:hypothetical protein
MQFGKGSRYSIMRGRGICCESGHLFDSIILHLTRKDLWNFPNLDIVDATLSFGLKADCAVACRFSLRVRVDAVRSTVQTNGCS